MFVKRIYLLVILLLSLSALSAGESKLRFIENKGQWNKQIQYNVRLNFGNIYFEKDKFTFLLIDQGHHHETDHKNHNDKHLGHHFNITFEGANKNVNFTYSGKSTHYFNYFLGNNPDNWANKVHEYERLTYRNLYNGIDLAIMGQGEDLKYEYYVAPQADPNQIKVKYNGIEKISIRDGNLFYHTTVCNIIEKAPYVYQYINGRKVEVACNYVLSEDGKTVEFEFPKAYNKKYELVIDPSLVFSRLSASTSDNFGFTATYDDIGRAYAGGIVFGVSGQYVTTLGSFNTSYNGGDSNAFGASAVDIGISCYNQISGALIYGTYIGGSGNELPNSMVVNNQGELVVLATTGSDDFPIRVSAFDNSFNGGPSVDLQSNGIFFPNGSDIAIFKLNNQGSNLVASTYFGGTENDGLNDDLALQFNYNSTDLHFNYGDVFRGEVIVDSNDNIYVASSTNSPDFPNLGAPSTLQGEQDAAVFKLSPNLNNLIFSRFLGGSNDDAGYAMKIDGNGNLFVDGGTKSVNFPIVGPSLHSVFRGGDCDGYIAKLNSINGSIIRSTFIGTSQYDQVYFVDLDDENNVYILGQTLGNYPVQNAGFSSPNGKQFIHKLDNNLNTSIYSTVFGTGAPNIDISPTALLVDVCERVYVSGWGGNTNQNRNGTLSNANISGMPITQGEDNVQANTSGGGDFYFFVLDKNATGQLFGSYFGGTAAEHVDGGTSRFDDQGIIYQAICAGCGGGSYGSTPGFSNFSSSNNCNVGIVKMDIGLPITSVSLDAFPRSTGCVPLTVNFESILEDVTDITWYFGDGNTSTGPSPSYTYIDTGVYQVILVGRDINSCNQVDSAFLTVTVEDDTLIATSIDTLSINCDNLEIFVGAIDVPTTIYDWDLGDGTVFLDAGFEIIHTYTDAGIYEIILHITDTTKCETEAWDTVSFEFAPRIEAEIGTNAACINTTFQMQNFSNPNAETFIWDLGNGQSSNEFEPNATYSSGGDFTITLTVIDSATCNFISSDTNVISIVASPSANFSTDTNYYLYPDLADFTNLSFNFDSFVWTFGDGESNTTNLDPSHFYKSLGDFSPCLKVSNDGCEDSICLDLFIDFIPLIGVPNAFSPNGDNFNDLIKVEGFGIIQMSFRIYNRWGELVYEGFNQEEGWDGSFKGINQEMEVFTYIVDALLLNNTKQILKGNITLLR
jgi:gliding motility-associated-like protein